MKLTAQTLPCRAVTKAMRARMFELLERYYEHVTQEQFEKDLAHKTAVILLLDAGTRELKGFSTILDLEVEHLGRPVYALYSGDTVVERAYWGEPALGRAFVLYLLKQKLRRPWRRCYWFLISKGYKTYLLMANNFRRHHPSREQTQWSQEQAQPLLSRLAARLFADSYQPETGLIVHPGTSCALREHVAPIDAELLAGNPRVAFFVEKNPDWPRGVELACLAEMTLRMPVEFFLKLARKQLWKLLPARLRSAVRTVRP